MMGMKDSDKLTPDELYRFGFLMMAFLRRLENIYHQGVSDRVTDEDWSGVRNSAIKVMAEPGARAWWKNNSTRFNPQFSSWISQEIPEISA
jgi:hypothetical protein